MVWSCACAHGASGSPWSRRRVRIPEMMIVALDAAPAELVQDLAAYVLHKPRRDRETRNLSARLGQRLCWARVSVDNKSLEGQPYHG